MADILLDLYIRSNPEKVFEAVTTPAGLNNWWTARSSGEARPGSTYELWFGPEYDWRAKVTVYNKIFEVEWEITRADEDWTGTRLGFKLEERDGSSQVRFYHTGWPEVNEHHRRSSYCWALYLRHLKRFVELGIVVPYDSRYEA